MNEFLAFTAGIAFRAIIGWLAVKAMGRPFDWLVGQVRNTTLINHYLKGHDGKSAHCHECLLGPEPVKVDTIS